MKTLKYLKYLIVHKYYVAKFCFRFGLYWRGLIHDWSKLLPDEFIPYREYFYGDHESWRDLSGDMKLHIPFDKTKEFWSAQFSYAWLRHIHRNDHHFQHFILRNDDRSVMPLQMPYKCVQEMVADWCGAGVAITGKLEVWNWYDKNRDNILLHPTSRAAAEHLIMQIKNDYEAGKIRL